MTNKKEIIIFRSKQKVLSKIPIKVSLNNKPYRPILPDKSLKLAIEEDIIGIKIKMLTIEKEFNFDIGKSKFNQYNLFVDLTIEQFTAYFLGIIAIIFLFFSGLFSGDYEYLLVALMFLIVFRDGLKRSITLEMLK
jgi:hypothetical protein